MVKINLLPVTLFILYGLLLVNGQGTKGKLALSSALTSFGVLYSIFLLTCLLRLIKRFANLWLTHLLCLGGGGSRSFLSPSSYQRNVVVSGVVCKLVVLLFALLIVVFLSYSSLSLFYSWSCFGLISNQRVIKLLNSTNQDLLLLLAVFIKPLRLALDLLTRNLMLMENLIMTPMIKVLDYLVLNMLHSHNYREPNL